MLRDSSEASARNPCAAPLGSGSVLDRVVGERVACPCASMACRRNPTRPDGGSGAFPSVPDNAAEKTRQRRGLVYPKHLSTNFPPQHRDRSGSEYSGKTWGRGFTTTARTNPSSKYWSTPPSIASPANDIAFPASASCTSPHGLGCSGARNARAATTQARPWAGTRHSFVRDHLAGLGIEPGRIRERPDQAGGIEQWLHEPSRSSSRSGA
jgi:hypothetical protein